MNATSALRDELEQVKVDADALSTVASELANAWKAYHKTPPSYRAVPPPFVLDESLFPIEQENQLIDYFYRYFTNNPKKLLQMCTRNYNNVPRFMQRSLLDNIMNAKDPVKHTLKYFSEKVRWGQIIEQMIAEGNHGVIYNDKEVWGFKVEANQKWLKEQDKWHMDDEKEILKKSYYKWAREHGKAHFEGKVMLFHQFGFSGMSYYFNHPIDDAEGY